jgi:hypothetical protein
MAIGRISGSVLKSNLTRNGTDLAFETNLLYLDVTNSRVGIGTSEPTTTLQVNGTTTTTGLTASGAIAANGSGNSITVADTLRIAQSGSGLRMTNVGAFDNDGSDNFRIFSTNDLILSSNGDSNTALTIDGTTQNVTINQDLGVTGTATTTGLNTTNLSIGGTAVTSTAAELNVLDGTTLGAANELCVVDPTGNFITTTSTLSIDQGNNYIGINQTSPEVTLHMTGEGAQTAQIRMEQYNDSADAPDIRTRRYRGTIDSPLAVNSGDYLFRSNHEYWNGTSLLVGGAFAFDNTNNANRTEYRIAVDTDGTGADVLNGWQFKIDGNDGGAITLNTSSNFIQGSAHTISSEDATGTYKARQYLLWGETTNATETEIFVGGVTNARIPVGTNTTINYSVQVVARRTDATGESAAWELKALADSFSGTVANVGNVYEVIVARDDENWLVDARADDANNSVGIYVTGAAGKTIRWVAEVETSEVSE